MYIIWSLINAAFGILFFALVLTLFFKGKKLFNNKYGNPIIVIFVIGVLGILNVGDKEFKNQHELYGNDIKTNTIKSVDIRMAENISQIFHLNTRFKKNEKNEFVPSFCRTDLAGFISGFDWESKSVVINKLDDNSFSYEVNGLMHWSLFGIKFYTQNKDFEGTLILEEY